MNNPFKDVEINFLEIRRKYRTKGLSRGEFIDQLKKLRIRDSQGRFWMIGAQSGKWYYFDGRVWVQADPPSPEAKRVKCFSCGQENEAGAEFCQHCGSSFEAKDAVCPSCGAKIESPFEKCPSCSRVPGTTDYAEEPLLQTKDSDNFVFRRLSPVSLFFLSGSLGLILGVIMGILAGASGFFAGLGKGLPEVLGTLQGTLMGGIVYALLGGVLGFVMFGTIGYLEAHVFNGICSAIGGIRIKLDKAKGEESEGQRTS